MQLAASPGPCRRTRRAALALVAAVLATATPASAGDFDAAEAAYKAYLARPSLFYRTRGRLRLAQTKDPRVVPILAQDYAKAEEPTDIVRSLIVTVATRHVKDAPEVLPAYDAWRSANTGPSAAWLWYRTLALDLALGGEAVWAAAKDASRGPWLRSAALCAAADAKNARALDVAFEALPPLAGPKPAPKKKVPPPKKGAPVPNPAEEAVPAALLAEAAAYVLERLPEQRGSEAWRKLAERVIQLVEDPGLSVITRSRIARSLARVFGTDNLGLTTGPWLRELASAASGGEGEPAPGGPTNYFFGIEVVGEHIAFVIDCSDSMLAPLTAGPTKSGTITPKDGPAGGQGPTDGLPWDRIRTRFDLAREVLKRSLRALRKDQHFTVVIFGTGCERLRDVKGMVPATPEAIASAIRALDDIQVDTEHTDAEHPYGSIKGKTNLHGGLRLAFRVRAQDEATASDYVDPQALEEGCDAIYLLSDGAPSWDDWAGEDTRDPDVQAGDSESHVKHENTERLNHFGPFVNAYGHDFIVDDVQRLNLFRHLPVHCIAIGEADDGLMRRIAKATDGKFERVKAAKPPPAAK